MSLSIDIIVPTWNEEGWLDRLLAGIRRHLTIGNIFVVDHNSNDITRQVAVRFGCHVVDGGRPAKARNIGARLSTADILIFIDADTIIDFDIIPDIVTAFAASNTVAITYRISPVTDSKSVAISYYMMHVYFKLLRAFGLCQGVGSIVAVRRSAFLSSGGFDESILAGEDADFYRRLSKWGRVAYIERPVVKVSGRRFFSESKFCFILKVVVWAALRLFGFRRSIFPYRWVKHDLKLLHKENSILQRSGAP